MKKTEVIKAIQKTLPDIIGLDQSILKKDAEEFLEFLLRLGLNKPTDYDSADGVYPESLSVPEIINSFCNWEPEND